jgi:phage terminase large subunit-like protein
MPTPRKPRARRVSPTATPTRADHVIKWIEEHCRVPEGKLVGQPVVLREWQKQEIRKIYDNPHGTRRAILSFGRKNGKTAIAAMLLLVHLCGPEARPNSQLYSAAQSRDQAALLFSLAAKMVRLNADMASAVDPKDSVKTLVCKELGTVYKALSADAATSYGLSPVFAVHDELGQAKGPRSELYDAIESASAAHDNPLSIIISTQAPTDADLLSVLIDDALTGVDPKVTVSLYTAGDDLDPWSDDALRAANPAFGDFQNADEVRQYAADAQRMPSREPSFRNLILNQRVEAFSPFVSRSVWDANRGPAGAPADFTGLPVYAGLDLSETSDLTAFVMMAQVDGLWHVRPIFWLPGEGLREKSAKDRVPYDTWHQQGFIETTPGKAVEYSYVAQRLVGLINALDIRRIGFDRYNMRHLRPWLVAAGLTEQWLDEHMEDFGQGFVGMGPAVRELEAQLLNNRLAHGDHPVLKMCAANAVAISDPAGNRKLDKQKSSGRIDGMVALAMANGVAVTAPAPASASIWDRAELWA